MNKHTPGPWVGIDEGWIEGSSGSSVIEYAGCGSHEANYPNPYDKSLILAAPDLLEALIAAEAKLCIAEYHLDKGEDDSVVFESEILTARAAIARARGES